MKVVSYSLRNGDQYFGTIDEQEFYIGSRVRYNRVNRGLMNTRGAAGELYDPSDFREQHGFWADFIYPIAVGEGRYFHTLNTYDSARFTFGFMQFAAHVPNGDFVIYLREVLKLPLAEEYFPDLHLLDGRVCERVAERSVPLESDDDTSSLQWFLNPSSSSIEDSEIIQSAKFVHWALNDEEHRATQVAVAVKITSKAMQSYARAYGLHGKPDYLCAVVADIRHQGRAKSAAIVAALRERDPLEALLRLGEEGYAERVIKLRRTIAELRQAGTFGTHTYDLPTGTFVQPASPTRARQRKPARHR